MSDLKPLHLQQDYIDRKIEQNLLWMNGVSKHDDVYDECCQDFSCCYPDLLEKDESVRFKRASDNLSKLFTRRNNN